VFFGLPHGAVDHDVTALAWLLQPTKRGGELVGVHLALIAR
jgi:hypothetical protein